MTPAPLSPSNARLKELRKLSRRSVRTERRLFLADGPKAVEGALAAGCVEELFVVPALAGEYADATLVSPEAMQGLSDSVSPAGVVALCRFIDLPVSALRDPASGPPTSGLWAICADVRDPGNAGTVIRCADAAGAAAVILAGDSVDLYNPKTIRASVGSAFHLPIAIERDPLAAIAAAKQAGLTVLAADMNGDADLFTADELLARPTAWLMGNEAWGIPEELKAAADSIVSIPIFGKAESLNLSTAAALCLYASARAHRRSGT
ncbi:TrmH family RNA methyltransferase [Nocardioides sp. Kera G14]|uniref:TrmH family RNA methyltransferase n=1 Tax=Nocardioides sp. Kera G14 TaxID=2884264 RepID=UPI001D1108C7|nr:RNA methyltransferase [Nocardioides sp. Kera G14]UDY25293.1 RNA methyltransferase [Nocardioides sp. Kera G14]